MLGLKVLVADDELHILQVVEYKLAAAGYRVFTAPCGQTALQVALTEQPDLLITDLQMPNMDGLELCRRLYEQSRGSGEGRSERGEAARDIPAILLTARSHDLDGAGGTSLPPNLRRIVTKPFSPRQLVTAVREITGEAA
jgi:CheY-like chemotaxis protein